MIVMHLPRDTISPVTNPSDDDTDVAPLTWTASLVTGVYTVSRRILPSYLPCVGFVVEMVMPIN